MRPLPIAVLSFMHQRRSSGTTPSALRVIDFTLPS